MEPFGLPQSPFYDVSYFNGNSVTEAESWSTWFKPSNKSRAYIIAFGAGGGGGNGFIGANSAAMGGGGGASGGMTVVDIPMALLPPRLYISVGHSTPGAGIKSIVAVDQTTNANAIVAVANGGGAGGNGSATTAGAAGSASSVLSSSMVLGWQFSEVIIGQTGTIGGTTGAPSGMTYPNTGLRVTGGVGGAGLGASGANGSSGGGINMPTSSYYLTHTGGVQSTSATVPPGIGRHGIKIDTVIGGFQFYGGTGGGSTHGSATGAGLVQAAGGDGSTGSGGGGSGGALTGSVPAVASRGGAGLVIIMSY
jgi:hypothetical protein